MLAIANLRGGGEYGEDWHQAGMLGKKQNVFDDFIAAAEWLIAKKYTDREHLAIQGGSNGGLLMGGRPDAAAGPVPRRRLPGAAARHAALSQVPDRPAVDPGVRLAPTNPNSSDGCTPIRRTSTSRTGTAYPAVLLTAAESDRRVDPLHARKMAARLQAATSSERPILLRLETKAGHGAGKPRAKVLDELTDSWSFVLTQLGMLK